MDTFILPLGTNGFMPSNDRQTMCFFLSIGNQAILLDAGTGLSRLHDKRVQKLIRPFKKLSIILSHYHLDHIIGLSYLSSIDWIDKIDVYGPAAPFVESNPKDAINQLISPPFSSLNFGDYPIEISINEIRNNNFQIGPVDIFVWPQHHPGGSIGININQTIAFVTDTALDHSNIKMYTDVRVLMHEVWLTDDEAQNNGATLDRHSSVSGVAEIAKIANINYLMPIHHHPFRDQKELTRIAKQIQKFSNTPTIIPNEGQVYLLKNGKLKL